MSLELLHSTTRLLDWNLEFYTIWNYRRSLLQQLNADESMLKNEISYTTQCLRKHPKSYWVWNHRRWCLEQMNAPDYSGEMALVSKMLDLDIRNCTGFLDLILQFTVGIIEGFCCLMFLCTHRKLNGNTPQTRFIKTFLISRHGIIDLNYCHLSVP